MGLKREAHSRPRSAITVPALWQLAVVLLWAQPALPQGDPVDRSGCRSFDRAGRFPAASLETAGYSQRHPGVEDAGPPNPPGRPTPCGWQWDLDCIARGYYLNDRRIDWSGVEAGFGAEAAVAPVLVHRWGDWETAIQGEFYLNQPFDQNILLDTPERVSYAPNWDVDPFEISQLWVAFRRGNLAFGMGKMATPFGRTYSPLLTNARLDAPFIRTESILWRETGLFFRYNPGWLVADVGLTNGCEDRDTNSSKALVSRVGIQGEQWALGASVKVQDGIGSEGQKTFKNHVGMDFMLRRDRWIFSGEVIYDEYGLSQPGLDPLDVTWGRSIYFRDQHYRPDVPITGIGYYVNLGYEGDRWRSWLNYGEFYPQELGDPRHDVPNRRGIVKVVRDLTSHLSLYGVAIVENGGYVAQDGRPREGLVVVAGLEWAL